jgi:hypothetical protein
VAIEHGGVGCDGKGSGCTLIEQTSVATELEFLRGGVSGTSQ